MAILNKQNHKNLSVLLKIFLFCFVLLLFTIVIFKEKFKQQFGPRQNQVISINPDGDTKIMTPWGENQTAQKIEQPSIIELHEIYKNISQSIEKRNYEQFIKYANSERIWHTENKKTLLGETQEGIPIFRKDQISGLENFRQNAPKAYNLTAPNIKFISPIAVTQKEKFTENDFLLVDQDNKNPVQIRPASWNNAYYLEYQVVDNPYVQGTGKVSFVYENNNWKYQGEAWTIQLKKDVVIGDFPADASKIHTITVNDQTNKIDSLSIKKGEGIIWQSVTGKIFAIPDSTTYWSSPFLDNSQFCKIFDEVGTYQYRVYNKGQSIYSTIQVN